MQKLYQFAGALPFFIAVFLNAFVDLGHKIIIQNTVFKSYDDSTQVILIAIVNGLILLPFILLFSPAGFVNDKYPKTQVMRLAAWGAVILTSAITGFYYLGYFWAAFAMTFLLAMQSAFYSPAKYGFIKVMFGKPRLAEANGVVQAISIVAILSGTLIYSSLFETWYPSGEKDTGAILQAIAPIGWLLVANALWELWLVYRIPILETTHHEDRFSPGDWITGRQARHNLKPLIAREVIRLSIIGLAMFWSVGQVMLAVFPAYAKETMGVTNTIVIQATLAAAGLGIALGSYIAGKASKNHIEVGLVPIGALGIAVGLWVMPGLGTPWLHAFNYLFIGTMGGLFIVPLNSLIQFHAGEHELGRILAASNLIQNIAMLSFLILTVVLASIGLPSGAMLLLIAAVAVIGGSYTVYKLPQSLLRALISYLMRSRYRIRVQGLKNIPSTGGVLLLGNHLSWIDWAILQIACPRPLRFVMAAAIYDRWYLRWFFNLAGCIPIAPGDSSEEALTRVATLLEGGEAVCLFPEGAISHTGHLGNFRPGYQRACAQVDDSVVILPFYLHGLWGSQWSRSSQWLKHNRAPGMQRDLLVAFGPRLPKDTPPDRLKRRILELSVHSWQRYAAELPSLGQGWLIAARRSRSTTLVMDGNQQWSPRQLLVNSLALAHAIRQHCPAEHLGVALPNGAEDLQIKLATLLAGKTLVCLPTDQAADQLLATTHQLQLTTLITTSRQAVPAELQQFTPATLTQSISFGRRWLYWGLSWLPQSLLIKLVTDHSTPDASAAIVLARNGLAACLSHRNIMANIKQISDLLNPRQDDLLVAALPPWQALSLTVTQLLPILEGLPVVFADPDDTLALAKTIARRRVTILCSNAEQLQQLVDHPQVHPLMLDSLRLVLAAGDTLSESLQQAFQGKFNRPVLTGYGVTETTPVASANLPDALDISSWRVQPGHKAGTVGMPLPGTACRVVEPDTLAEKPTGEVGLLLIGGVQVMSGYFQQPEATRQAIVTLDDTRWFITGDWGSLDADGFLSLAPPGKKD